MLCQGKQHDTIDGYAAGPGNGGALNSTELDQVIQGSQIDREFKRDVVLSRQSTIGETLNHDRIYNVFIRTTGERSE